MYLVFYIFSWLKIIPQFTPPSLDHCRHLQSMIYLPVLSPFHSSVVAAFFDGCGSYSCASVGSFLGFFFRLLSEPHCSSFPDAVCDALSSDCLRANQPVSVLFHVFHFGHSRKTRCCLGLLVPGLTLFRLKAKLRIDQHEAPPVEKC